MGQLVLTITGAVIGNYLLPGIGGPIGAAIGSTIGGLLFPQKTPHPPLADAHIMVSNNGAFIPITYGSIRVGAVVVDAPAEFTRHETGGGGGKGGPSVPATATYSVDWLRALFGESRGDRDIGRIWHTGRLVADYRQGSTSEGDLQFVFYDGASDQLPDPTEETHYGVGMVSAYRNVATGVYKDLQLGDLGNALPVINAELIQGQTHTDHPISLIIKNNNPTGHQFALEATAGPPAGPAVIDWPRSGDDPIRVHGVNTSTTYTYDAETLAYIGSEASATGDAWPVDALELLIGLGYYRYANNTTVPLWGICGRFKVNGDRFAGPTYNHGMGVSSSLPTATGDTINGTNFLLGTGMTGTDRVQMLALSQDGRMLFVGVTTAVQVPLGADLCDKWYKIVDGTVESSGTILPKIGGGSGGVGPCGPQSRSAVAGNLGCGMFENDYMTMWYAIANTQIVSVYQIDDAGNFSQSLVHYVLPPAGSGGGLILTGDVSASSCTAIYAMPEGCRAGYVYGKSLWLVERCLLITGVIQLMDIVADQHERCGDDPANYDVSELTDIVRGYGIFAPPTGRSVIESLEDLYAFKSVDSDTGVRYVKLGKPAITTIPDGDLCVHDENGNAIPSPLQVTLGNDIELPALIWLKYFDFNADYQVGAQQWHRQETLSKITRTIETALVLTATEAKQMVDQIGQRMLIEADKYTWFTTRGGTAVDSGSNPLPYIILEPTDVVTVKGLDLRIETKTEQLASGIIRWTGVRSHPGVVVQTGTGGGESTGFTDPSIPVAQETELALIDAPYIQDEDKQAVLTVAAAGADRESWRGMVLNKSLDGTNYTDILTSSTPAIIGETLTALQNFGSGNVADESSSVDVQLHPGSPDLTATLSRGEWLAGVDPLLIGAEVVFARERTLIGAKQYRLKGFLRGRHSTELAIRTHAIGDLFTALASTLQTGTTHIDYGYTRYYKAPTIGRTLATASAQSIRSNGLSLAPYSPAHLGMGFVPAMGDNDVLITWQRRTRLHGQWIDFIDVPVDEESEKYEVTIWADGTYQTVKRRIVVTEEQCTYGVDDQTTDFGAPLTALPAVSVAQVGRLGRGYDTLGRPPIMVPDGTTPYIPPNPPLDDPRFVLSTFAWVEDDTVDSGVIGPTNIWIITVPIGSTPTTTIPVLINAAEFGGYPPTGMEWTLSTVAGDFGPQGHTYAWSHGQSTNSVTAQFHCGAGGYLSNVYFPTFPTSSTIYLNIRPTPSGYDSFRKFATIKNIP